ncbi:MAG: hypothetical protein CVU69_08515 [Deltaproteobacteria bacterium HGW-Deltaproteobacteria-4]|nr:MAG: hypothetical protein CVU69_08515 [Deltaproteobacteria bacterium HGW-Deltaproteobacteria-4]
MRKYIISTLCLLLVLMSCLTLYAADPRVVRVGAFNYYPAIFKDTDGAVKGFYVDALADIAQRENIRFEYVYGSWSEGLERIKSGEVDVLTSAAVTPTRAEFLDYGKTPLLTVWGELYVPISSDIDGIRAVQGKKIAVMKNDFNALDFIKLVEKFDITCEFIEMPGFEEVFNAVATEKVDAGVVSSTFGVAKQKEFGLRSTGVAFNPFDIYFAVAKEKNGDLLVMLDNYLHNWRHQKDSPYNKARQKWSHGSDNVIHVIPDWLMTAVAAMTILALCAFAFILMLKKQVSSKTRSIIESSKRYQIVSERQNAILAAVPDIIMEVDTSKVYTWANPAGLEFFGDDVVGKEASFYFAGEQNTYEVVQPLFDRLEEVIYIENLQRRKDGTVRLLAWWCKVLVDEQGVVTGTLSSARDITESKTTEEQLRRYIHLFRKTEEIAQIGGWELTISSMELFWSEQTYLIHEVTLDAKVTVEEAISFYTPETRPLIQDVMQAAIESGTPFDLELQINTTMGNLLWVRVQGEAEYDSGKIAKIFGTIQDITGQKQAEEELIANTVDLRESQRIAHVGSWRLNIASNQVVWSEELYSMYGFDPTLPPPPYTEHQKLFTPESWERLSAAIQNTRSTGIPYDLELKTLRLDGSSGWMWVRGMQVVDENGVTIGLRGMAQDITEQKQIDEVQSYLLQINSISPGEDFFETLARYLANTLGMDYVCIDTLHGDCLSARTLAIYNDGRFEDNVEYTLKDTPCGDVAGKEICVFPREVCSLFPHDAALQELQAESYVGTTLWSFDMKPIGLIAVIGRKELLDSHFAENVLKLVSVRAAGELERRQAYEEKHLIEQQFQQTQRLESLGVLAGGIAHDFNNILTIIVGYCGMTKMDFKSAEKNIPKIEKAAERAAALCRQMLAYAGKATLSESQVNVRTLVDEMASMLKTTIPHNVVIKPDLSSDILFIMGDASQLRQVVMNLIINAAEAIGDAEGEIDVKLARAEIKAERPEKDYLGMIIPPGRYICFEVKDNGCGMDEDTRCKIFEPFYTTKFTGRGLGLSAVLGIIKAHNGAWQMESRLGHGTTFRVYLPVQPGISETEEAQPITASAEWQGSGTILLAEDEEQVKTIAIILLQELGFTVLDAANGKEALELYQQNAADITLVVTDMGMPVMNGYELFHKLKQLNPQLPIIISSGFGEGDISSKIPSEEIAGLINKPYRFEHLREVLRSAVERSPDLSYFPTIKRASSP